MAQQLLNLKISGLWTNPNDFSEVPPGSMSNADNVVIDRESIVESRRGYKTYGVLDGYDVSSLFSFNNTILALTDNHKLYRDTNNTGAFVAYTGFYARPDTKVRSRSTLANKNLYFTTDNGLMKLTSVDSTPRFAGAPKALAGTAVTAGASGWFDDSTSVAYRVVWGYKDANNNLVLGPPSDRIIVSNTAGASRNTNVTFLVPTGIDTSWFYQVYRSPMSPDLVSAPSDDLQQVYENNPTAGEITAKSITVTDIVTESLKQAALYTNATQEGIENANWAPPFAKDICTFKNYTFYANTRTLHRSYFNLISVGPTLGLQIGDTITVVNGVLSVTLTGAAVENVGLNEFKVDTSLTPAENVENTARSIVNVLNKSTTNTFINAFYTSGYDELPGQILFEKRNLSTGAFQVNSSRDSCWSPRLPTSGNAVESSNDVMPNRIYYSKLQQPESVPLLNYIDVGSSNEPIERILTLRDGIIILKTDGIYRLIGDTDNSFRVSLVDSTVKILAPESAVVLSNRVYFYSDQGVIAASDGGAQVISRPIENLINHFSATSDHPNLYEEAFGISYESDHKYILFVPTNMSDTYSKQAYVFNIFTNNWTRWTIDANCGIQNPYNNKLYLGTPYKDFFEPAQVKIERKNYDETDYAEIDYDVTILSIDGDKVYLDEPPTLVAKMKTNDTIYQDGQIARIEEVDETNFEYVIVSRPNPLLSKPLVPGVVTVYRPVSVSFTFNSLDAENPGVMKHFQRIAYFIDDASFDRVQVRFQSDLSDLFGDTTVFRQIKGVWGSGEWGNVLWGGGNSGVQRVDSIIPQTNQRANWLTITISSNTVFNAASLNGISITYNVMGERFK